MSDADNMHLNANVLEMLNDGAIGRVYQKWLVEFKSLEGTAYREAWNTAVDALLGYLDTEDGVKSRDSIETLIGRILHERLENHEEARAILKAAQRAEPESQEVLELLTSVHRALESWGQYTAYASMELASIDERDSDWAEKAVQLATITQEELKRPAVAYRWVCKALEADPNHARLLHLADRLGGEVDSGPERFEELRKLYISIRDRRQRSATMIQEASQWFDEVPSDLDRGRGQTRPQQGC